MRFGHIRGFNHSTTLDHFHQRDWRLGNYSRLSDEPKWIASDSNSGRQLADLLTNGTRSRPCLHGYDRASEETKGIIPYAGILGAAIIPDRFGNFEASYIETIKHQIRKSPCKKISGYSIKAISPDNDPQSFKWWLTGWT